MVMLPSSGTLLGSTATAKDPHKIGRVLWARDSNGLQAPLDLHNRVPVSDLYALNRIFHRLIEFRKLTPALEVVRDQEWCQWTLVKPYIIASVEGRSEARTMMMEGTWESFWQSIDLKCVRP